MKFSCLTICSVNYLAKSLVLADSFIEFNPEVDFYLLLVDRKIELPKICDKIKIIWVEDLGIANWERYAFNYDVIEFNTVVKPFALLYLLKTYENAIYLDPDIEVFSSFTSVWQELESNDVLVTPHYFTPIIDNNKPDDIELLKFGGFNLGFIALSSGINAINFLNWWSLRCLENGYYEPQSGLGVDQKWVSIAPCFFDGIKVSRNAGLNLAFWNLHERRISFDGNTVLVNGTDELVFIHFSSFDETNPSLIAKKQDRFSEGSRQDFIHFATSYAQKLNKKKETFYIRNEYSFDYFDDNEYISPALRRFYSQFRGCDEFNNISPFSAGSKIRNFAKRNKLLIPNYVPGQRLNFKNLNDASKSISVINFFLKIVLRIIGPINYFNLMRYMAHISSIRNQTNVLR